MSGKPASSGETAVPKRYFVFIEGDRRGPFGARELVGLARSGELSPDDQVWLEGAKNGVAARQVKGLFDSPSRSQIQTVRTPVPAPRSPLPKENDDGTSGFVLPRRSFSDDDFDTDFGAPRRAPSEANRKLLMAVGIVAVAAFGFIFLDIVRRGIVSVTSSAPVDPANPFASNGPTVSSQAAPQPVIRATGQATLASVNQPGPPQTAAPQKARAAPMLASTAPPPTNGTIASRPPDGAPGSGMPAMGMRPRTQPAPDAASTTDADMVADVEPPQAITAKTFKEALRLAAEHDRPALVIFSADWCGYCKKLQNKILTEPGARAAAARFVVVVLDSDDKKNKDLKKRFEVKGLPLVVATSASGEELKRLQGCPRSATDFVRWVGNTGAPGR